MRGTRVGKYDFGCILHMQAATKMGLAAARPPMYHMLIAQVMRFFETGVAPISAAEMFAIMAFLEAADQSKASGGKSVELKTL
jgi:hypothetical protein